MKLSIRGMAVSVALLWGAVCMFLVGLANIVWPGYGQALLDMAASFYPGYNATPDISQVIIGTLWGLADGAFGGAVFAWLYNQFATTRPNTV